MSTTAQNTVTIREDNPTDEVITDEEEELTPAVEVEELEKAEPTIDDVIDSGGDPRQLIAKKHQDRHRNFSDQDEDSENELNAEVVDGEQTSDIIDPNQPEMVDIKVNGRTLSVEKERVDKAGGVQAYQKEVAVNDGFQTIKTRQKELDNQAALLAQQAEELAAREKALSTTDEQSNDQTNDHFDLPEQGDHSVSDLVKQHREALLDGDDTTADAVMTQLLSIRDSDTPSDTKIDAAEIQTRAAEIAIEKIDQREYANSVLKARQKLYSDHPELKQDTQLFNQVDTQTSVVRDEWMQDPERESVTPDDIFAEAYRRVASFNGGAPAQTTLETRLEEKRSISRPKAASTRSQPKPPPKRETRSDYVAKLKNQRGQGD